VAGFRLVVEDVPADGAPTLLIIENEFTDSGRELHPLPLPFLGPSLRSVVGRDACTGRPDSVRGSAQVMGGDVRHRGRLACRQCSELRCIGHPARRRIRLESRSACVTHPHLTACPGSTSIDSVAGPAVTWLMIFEQMQHVLGAHEGPLSQQSVVFVGQSAPATDGDQPRITPFREDRHTPSPTIHEADGSRPERTVRARFRWPSLSLIGMRSAWLRPLCLVNGHRRRWARWMTRSARRTPAAAASALDTGLRDALYEVALEEHEHQHKGQDGHRGAMTSGHRNAFQLAIKVITAIAAKKAPELGTTTRQYAPKYPSPSTRAASSRLRGKLRKYGRNRNVEKPLKSTGTMIP
jgi:hypothetical protein